MSYLAVYRAHLPKPTTPVPLVKGGDYIMLVHAGSLKFLIYTPELLYESPVASLTFQPEELVLPKGCYVIIKIQVVITDPRLAFNQAALRVAELATLFDIRYPDVLISKSYEGFISTEESGGWIGPSPLKIKTQPVRSLEYVVSQIASDVSAFSKLSPTQRERYQLAARWFRRGHEVESPVDKFLCWWTVLEIFPGEGSTRVPEKVCDLLASTVYADMKPHDIKTKTQIGPIYGMRTEIIHKGKAFVQSDEEGRFFDCLNRLRATAAVCLCLLARIPSGDDLDRFLKATPA